jgi:pilus assembly protein CpaB
MKSKFILIIALTMAIITTVLFRQYLVSMDNKAKAANKTVTVVVANIDIKANQKVNGEMLVTKEVNTGSILTDAIKKTSDVVGKYTVTDLKAGEVLYPVRFTDLVTETKDLTLKIAEGARAVSIGVSDVTAVAKMIQPEDYVDIINTQNGQTSVRKCKSARCWQNTFRHKNNWRSKCRDCGLWNYYVAVISWRCNKGC